MKKHKSLIIWAIIGVLPLAASYSYKTFINYCSGEGPAGFADGCVEPDSLFIWIGYILLFAVLVIYLIQFLVRKTLRKTGQNK